MAEEVAPELTIEVNGTKYPFPTFDTLTYKEARLIKSVTGVVMGQFFQALENGDPDSLVAIALVALGRAGVTFDPSDLDDLPITNIKIDTPKPEAEPEPASPLDDSVPSSEHVIEDAQPSNVVGLSGELDKCDFIQYLWQPWMGRYYKWQPWELENLTPAQVHAALEDLKDNPPMG